MAQFFQCARLVYITSNLYNYCTDMLIMYDSLFTSISKIFGQYTIFIDGRLSQHVGKITVNKDQYFIHVLVL